MIPYGDADALENIINDVLDANPKQLGQYLDGKESVLGWFVGQVMKATGGKANPKAVNEIVAKKLAL